MPEQITMPQLSDTMTEGTLIKWLKKEGEEVAEGENIAEVETDKATMEVESFESGTLAYAAVAEGDKVPVGELMGVIATKGEDAAKVKAEFAGGGDGKKSAPAKAETSGATTGVKEKSSESSSKAPARRAGSTGEGDEKRSTVANDSGGPQTVTMDMPEGDRDNGETGRIKASPLARRIAEQNGIDLASLEGSGPGGRIVQADVMAAAEAGSGSEGTASSAGSAGEATRAAGVSGPAPSVSKPPVAMTPRIASGEKQVLELTKMRLAIASALQKSKQQLPHFYETVDIDMTQASALRQRLNKAFEKEGVRLSIGDIIAKAVAVALKANPVLNSTFDGTKITRHGDVHLGMAVALPDGLIVPVLRSIDQMGFKEIRQRSADLVDRARKQKLKRDEMSGGTFTVSNLGAFGVRDFVAIINPPEVGILAIGASEKRAVVAEDGSIVAREMMSVTLSSDHRAVDGADAARFLASLKMMLEEPGLMLA